MITVIIPTLNEEGNIEKAIDSVDFNCDILVIDSYSTDHTVELAKSKGAKVIQREFDDFSSQKNYAIEQVKTEWVFILDADERMNPDISEEITSIVHEDNKCNGFYVYRNFYYKDVKIKYGGWQTDKVLRLFRKAGASYDGKLVHEKMRVPGQVGYLKNRIDHYSFINRTHYLSKLTFYAQLQARELKETAQKVMLFDRIFKPTFRFFVLYLLRFGFLDGKRGYELAKLHAFGVKLRHREFNKLE